MTENPAITSIRSTIRNLKARTESGGFLNTELNAARAELERVEGQIANTEETVRAWEEVLEQLGRDQKTLDKAQAEFLKRHEACDHTYPLPPSITGVGASAGSIVSITKPDQRTYLVN